MKNLFLSTAVLLAGFSSSGQTAIEGSNQYGRLKDICYNLSVPDKLYAASNFGNHLLASTELVRQSIFVTFHKAKAGSEESIPGLLKIKALV